MGLQWEQAYAIVKRTLPFVLHRAMLYGGLCLSVVTYLFFLALIGKVFGAGAFWVLLVLSAILAIVLGLATFVGELLFYRQRLGHIALISEVIGEGRLAEGVSQVKWARGRVLHYFGGVTFPRVRGLLSETLQWLNRKHFDASEALPAAGVDSGSTLAQRVLALSQGYIEEAAFAYMFKSRKENVFESARSAILIYCDCWKSMLNHAVQLTLLGYAFALVSTVVALFPLGAFALCVDVGTITRFTLFAVGVFAGFSAKWVLFDPLACAMMSFTFLGESDIVRPNPEWESALAGCESYERLKAAACQYAETDATAGEIKENTE